MKPTPSPPHRDAGLRVIIAYKMAKAGVQLLLAIVAGALLAAGLGRSIHDYAVLVRQHAVESWSIALADWFVRMATGRREWVVVFALAGDGVLSFAEGWSLLRGYRWGPWAVALVTATLLPFEIVGLVRHPRLTRALLLAGNALVFAYLAWHAVRHARRFARP